MPTVVPSPFLRQAFVADAATSAACGLMVLVAAAPLAGVLGLPEGLLRLSGTILLPYAALVAWLGLRERLATPLVWTIVIANAAWAADSVLLLAGGFVEPTRAGQVFVMAQALAVLMYAELQFLGLRRSEALAD